MNRAIWTTVARAFRRAALPLASYYAVTLALPLANGAAQSGAPLVDHALAVLVVPPVVVMLACAVHKTSHALASAFRSAMALPKRRRVRGWASIADAGRFSGNQGRD